MSSERPCEDTWRREIQRREASGKKTLTKPQTSGFLNCEKRKVSIVKATQSVILCYDTQTNMPERTDP